jgi:hypothetical protein
LKSYKGKTPMNPHILYVVRIIAYNLLYKYSASPQKWSEKGSGGRVRLQARRMESKGTKHLSAWEQYVSCYRACWIGWADFDHKFLDEFL